jgi:hypothetical protein
MALAGDGTVFVACSDTTASTLKSTVTAVGPDGWVLAGWPPDPALRSRDALRRVGSDHARSSPRVRPCTVNP